MEIIVQLISFLFIILGSLIILVGSLGLLRLPDVFSRIHAVGMIDTAGAGFIILGMTIYEGFTLVTVKLLFVGVFLFFTSPIATHAVAQVAFLNGVKPVGRNLIKPSKTKQRANKNRRRRNA